MQNSESDLIFAPEDHDEGPESRNNGTKPWKVLIIDDEPGIHDVTRLALKDFEFAGRSLTFLSAYSATQAREILDKESDIAVALVDVVMEEEHAGLDLVKYIRGTLRNELIRLVLRTGQPGQAPERKVIREYDINDYKEKTELTSQKLYSTIYTSLRSYRDLVALDNNRRGLEHIINASAEIFTISNLNQFVQGVLEQMVALLYLGEDAMFVDCESLAFEEHKGQGKILAATGRFEELVGKSPQDTESMEIGVYRSIQEAHAQRRSILREKEFVGYFQPREGRHDVIYVRSDNPLSHGDLRLVELFLRNVSIAYENVMLREEIEGTQKDMVYMLGEAIETRSRETGQHVRRVAEYCRLVALGMGLSERDAEILHIASPLHDFGKIGIPDGILHHPGALGDHEWAVMKTHAQIGADLLARSEREILKAASIIAGDHHEKWNGSGYPNGKKGEEIHVYGRICAMADVFDALGSKRCYKDAWPIEQIVEFLKEQRGEHFDPTMVDWVLENLDQMKKVREQFPD